MSESTNDEPSSHLPVVTPEIGRAALQNSEENGKDHILVVGRRLAETQPYLDRIVGDWIVDTARDPLEQKNMLEMAHLVFELLDSQATADVMNARFGES